MTQSGTCMGCLLQPWFINPNLGPSCYIPLSTDSLKVFNDLQEIKLTEQELFVLKKLGEAWNGYISLKKRSDSNDKEFLDSIHRAQQIIALRVARRVNPEVWYQP